MHVNSLSGITKDYRVIRLKNLFEKSVLQRIVIRAHLYETTVANQ